MRQTIQSLKTNDCFRPIKARAGKLLKIKLPCLSCHSLLLEEKPVAQTPCHITARASVGQTGCCAHAQGRPPEAGWQPARWPSAQALLRRALCTGVRISWGCRHRLPHTSWLRTTKTCPLAVLGSSLRSGVAGPHSFQRLSKGTSFPASSSFWWLGLSLACNCIPTVSSSAFTWPVLSVCVCLIRTFVIGCRAHSHNPGQSHLGILNLITSTEPLSLNRSRSQVRLLGLGHGYYLWGVIMESTTIGQRLLILDTVISSARWG